MKKSIRTATRSGWRRWLWVVAAILVIVILSLQATYVLRPQSQAHPTLTATSQVAIIPASQTLVPAGDFLMGSSDFGNEKPQHTVYLDAFWIDKREVSNGLYQQCVAAGSCSPPSKNMSLKRLAYYGVAQYNNYPVIYISWQDARSYCAWAGQRLPSEAEWEKAARGTDGRLYPWGNTPPTRALANFDDKNGPSDTMPIDSFADAASPYGAINMAGNVWEWVADWYQVDFYSSQTAWRNPQGPSSGTKRVIRGGSLYNLALNLRSFSRLEYDPALKSDAVGFRCARDDAHP